MSSLILLMLCIHALPPSLNDQAEPPRTYALLIGVGNYQTDSIPSLSAPKEDVALMQAFLTRRNPDTEFHVLLDQKATRENIIAKFKILEQVKAQDTVIIYFSGHGSTTKDLNGDELFGEDSTWVVYDSRPDQAQRAADAVGGNANGYDLLDDEINEYLFHIPTSRLIVISDSCHSGSITRDEEKSNMHGIAEDLRSHPSGKRFSGNRPVRGIRLSASKDEQRAFEENMDGITRSRFTWLLIKAMEASKPNETWRQTMDRVRGYFKQYQWNDQTPQIEGDDTLTHDFSPGAEGRQTYQVEQGENNRWVLPAGEVSGVYKGSEFAHGGTRLKVTGIEPFKAYAEHIAGPAPEVGDAFVLAKIVLPTGKIRVTIHSHQPTDADLATWLENFLKSNFSEAVRFVEARHQWGFRLAHRPAGFKPQAYSIPNGGPNDPIELWVVNASGHPLLRGPILELKETTFSARDIEILEEHVHSLLRREFFLKLASPHETDFVFKPVIFQEADETQEIPPEPKSFRSARGQLYVETEIDVIGGEAAPKDALMGYDLQNLAKEDRYLYLVALSSNGQVGVLFPNRHLKTGSERFSPGQTIQIRGSSLIRLDTAGQEFIRLISSPEPLDTTKMTAKRSSTREGGVPDNPLNLFTTDATRAGGLSTSWSTQLFPINVQ